MTAIVVVLVALLAIFLLTRLSWVISRRERRSINDYGETLDVLAKLSSQTGRTQPRTGRGPSAPEDLPEPDGIGPESPGPEQPQPGSLLGPLQLGNARRLRSLGRPSRAAPPPATASGANRSAVSPAGAGGWARPRPRPAEAEGAPPDAETPVPVGPEVAEPDQRQERPAMVFVDDSVLDAQPGSPTDVPGAASSAPRPGASERTTRSPADWTPRQPRPEPPRWPTVETGSGETVIRLGFGEEQSASDARGPDAHRTEPPGPAAASRDEVAAASGADAQAHGLHPSGAPPEEESGEESAGQETGRPLVFIDDAGTWGATEEAEGLAGSATGGPPAAGLRPSPSRRSPLRPSRTRASAPRRFGLRPPSLRPPGPKPASPGAPGTGPVTETTRRRSGAHRRRAMARPMTMLHELGARARGVALVVAAKAASTTVWQGVSSRARGATRAAAAKAPSMTTAVQGVSSRAKGAAWVAAVTAAPSRVWEWLSARVGGATRAAAALAGVAVAVVVAIVLALTLGGGGGAPSTAAGHRRLAASPPPSSTTTTVAPVALVTSDATDATYQVALPTYTLALTSNPGPCWVEVRTGNPSGPVVFQGLIEAGQTQTVPASGPLWVRVGFEANIQMSVNGMAVQGTTPTPTPYNFTFVTR